MSLAHGQDEQLRQAPLQLAEKTGNYRLAVSWKRCAVFLQRNSCSQCLPAVLIQAALKALQLELHAPGPQISLVSLRR